MDFFVNKTCKYVLKIKMYIISKIQLYSWLKYIKIVDYLLLNPVCNEKFSKNKINAHFLQGQSSKGYKITMV